MEKRTQLCLKYLRKKLFNIFDLERDKHSIDKNEEIHSENYFEIHKFTSEFIRIPIRLNIHQHS